MAKFRLELYDSTNSSRELIIPTDDLVFAKMIDELNGDNSLSIGISRGSDSWSMIENRKFIRVVNLDDESYLPFRIKQKQDIRTEKDSPTGFLECEHIKYDMLEEIYPKWTPYVQAEPLTVMNEIMGESSFTVGTISPATKLDVVLNFGSVLELVDDVRERLGSDLIVNNDKTVSILPRGTNRSARLRYTRNLTGIRRNIDTRDLFNVVYPAGGGEPPADIGGDNILDTVSAEHIVESISGATISSHSRLVPSDDSWNNYHFEVTRAVGGVSIGVRRKIIDSIAGSQVVITTALSSLTVGDYFKIVADASGTDFNYIRDAASIASHGTVEAAHFNKSIVEARNLLFNPDFSREFVSGIGENWSVVTIGGSFPVAAVTDPNFVRYGSKSQKIEEADAGEGIKQSVILETDSIYSLYVWVYVISGNVKLELNDGVDDQPSASGETAETSIIGVWTQLIVEGITAKTTVGTVKILSNSAQSEFYVDSVMVEKAARLSVPNEFYPISGARLLWDEGFDTLQENKTPKTKYIINAVDLYEMDPDAFQYDKIEVGDTILVQDDELGIDISARVQSKKMDLLEPWKTEYEIENFVDRLPKTLRNEARRNSRLNQSVGNLMGRRVDDRRLSNSGLSVNKRELHILG